MRLPSPHRALDAFADSYRRFGPVNGSLWLVGRALSVLTHDRCRIQRYYFVAQPVPRARRASTNGTITLRWVHATDPIVEQFPRPPEIIAGRFAMGSHCLVAERRGEFVGFLWLKERNYPEDDVRCRYVLEPSDEAAFDFDVYVEPPHRVGRTFARLWDEANAWLAEHGYGWSISRISAFKPESLAAHRRLGTQRIGSAIFLCIGTLQISLLHRAPFVQVGWNERNAPVVQLSPPKHSANSTKVPRMTTSTNG
jgi:hypothetical protein